jgi:hypothetical protein
MNRFSDSYSTVQSSPVVDSLTVEKNTAAADAPSTTGGLITWSSLAAMKPQPLSQPQPQPQPSLSVSFGFARPPGSNFSTGTTGIPLPQRRRISHSSTPCNSPQKTRTVSVPETISFGELRRSQFSLMGSSQIADPPLKETPNPGDSLKRHTVDKGSDILESPCKYQRTTTRIPIKSSLVSSQPSALPVSVHRKMAERNDAATEAEKSRSIDSTRGHFTGINRSKNSKFSPRRKTGPPSHKK